MYPPGIVTVVSGGGYCTHRGLGDVTKMCEVCINRSEEVCTNGRVGNVPIEGMRTVQPGV